MITGKNIIYTIKKNGFNAFLILFTLILLFSPDAKAWLLQQLLKTGLFNTKIEAGNTKDENTSDSISFELRDMKGGKVTSEALKGKVVFMNFWASWCPPCRAEMPSLQALYNKLKDNNGIVFLFVTEDDVTAKAIEYLQEHHLNIPVYAHTGEVPKALFSGALPTTVVIDKQGKILQKHEGIANYNTAAFIQQLQNLL